jgi:hypothetical protein
MTINDNKKDLRWESSCLPQINYSWRCTGYDVWKRWIFLTKCNNPLKNRYGLRTLQGIYSGKWTLRELKKIADDAR